MEDLRECCRLLGVSPGDEPAVIRRAYYERAKETHPDITGSGTDHMQRLNEA